MILFFNHFRETDFLMRSAYTVSDCNLLSEAVLQVFNKHTSLRKKFRRGNYAPFSYPGLRNRYIGSRVTLRHKFFKCSSQENQKLHKNYQNKCAQLRKQTINQILRGKCNQKWNCNLQIIFQMRQAILSKQKQT